MANREQRRDEVIYRLSKPRRDVESETNVADPCEINLRRENERPSQVTATGMFREARHSCGAIM